MFASIKTVGSARAAPHRSRQPTRTAPSVRTIGVESEQNRRPNARTDAQLKRSAREPRRRIQLDVPHGGSRADPTGFDGFRDDLDAHYTRAQQTPKYVIFDVRVDRKP